MLSASVKEAWQANSRVNKVLLDHLTPEMLSAQTPGGGYTVTQHLAHFTGSTKYWGMRFDEASLAALPDLFEGDDDVPETFTVETDLERFKTVMAQTAETVLEAAEAATEMGDSPHSSPDAYLIHMMVHNAHHRGQVLLALKTSGFPLPDDNLVWGPWKDE